MKKIILLSLMSICFTLQAQTNTSSFDAVLQTGVAQLEKSITVSELSNTADYFNKLAAQEQHQWLSQYYAAYGKLILGIRGKQDEETKDGIYEQAMDYANKADALSTNNSEIILLKGYITFMQMSVYPQQRAMTMIPLSNTYIDKAIALDPNNPRAHLLKGQNAYYTPEMFGGDKTAAKKHLLIAKALFEKSPAKNSAPSWGKLRVNELLKTY